MAPAVKFERLAIPDLVVIVPPRYGDARGYFAETFSAGRFAELGIAGPFVQDNQSLSRATGTLRGLHCQVAPSAQGKLVRALRGAIWDVAVDARAGSASYGQWAATTLTEVGGEQLWVPPGFLHGFVTLEPDSEIFYKVTAGYDPASERGVIWNDPALAIAWPVTGEPVLSEKDRLLPPFSAAAGWFA
jgi:dTDP-4-dehydrorhamnose 3,5-epimerase